MASRKVIRSYSGGGYGSSTDDSGEMSLQQGSESALQRIARRKKKRKQPTTTEATTAATPAATRTSLLLAFLVFGLSFCLLDALYIMKYIMQQQQSDGNRTPALPTSAVDAASRTIQTLPPDWSAISANDNDNKEPILKLLQEAVGEVSVDPETVRRLPTVKQVADLYGRAPVVLGLETCAQFQAHGDPTEHFVSTAGTFNTGTNLMAELLIANCVLPARMQKYQTKGVRWQVVWGKHTPVDDEAFRQTHRTYNDSTVTADNMFPAVTVRDPFKWMQSVRSCSIGSRVLRETGQVTYSSFVLSLTFAFSNC
jgi:hypothetical protein